MRTRVISICSTLALIAACSGGAGTATSLRGGPDGIPNSSTDSPGNGYEPPGNSNQDAPGNSNQDSTGGSSAATSCISCAGVYACTVTSSTTTTTTTGNGADLIGLVPAANGCGVIDVQNGPVTGTLVCGGAISLPSGDDTQGVTETWSGGSGSITITASASGETLVITCRPTSQALPTSTSSSTSTGGSDVVDAG